MGGSSIPPGPASYIPPSSSSYGALPVPPGTSPFHVKGLAYRGFEAYANRHVEGGFQRVRDELKDPGLREYLMQPFLAGSWYDVLPVVPLACAIAAAERLPVEDFVRRSARRQALYDAQHVHKRFSEGHSPSGLLPRLPRLFLQYTDFGGSEIVDMGDSPGAEVVQGAVVRTGVPAYILPWFVPMTEAYIETVLGVMGSERPRVKGQVSPRDGEVGGLPTVAVRFRVMW